MTLNRRTFISLASVACSGVWPAAPALAQSADAAPVTIVIPFAPGGASDVAVRLLADGLARELRRPVVIENKGGAGGLIAAAAVGRAAPDGHTLLYGNQGQLVVARHLFPVNGAEPRSVLIPLTLTARTQFFLVVPASSPTPSVTALVAAGRGGRLKVGIPGVGSPPHLATVLFGELTGAAFDLIPYQGSAPLLVDLIAGRLDAAFDNVASSQAHVRAGRLRALGVSGIRRAEVAPEVPTLSEAGINGYAFQSWQGLFAPKGMTGERASEILAAVHRALTDSGTRGRMAELGLEVATTSKSEFEALIARDAEVWDAKVGKGLIRPA